MAFIIHQHESATGVPVSPSWTPLPPHRTANDFYLFFFFSYSSLLSFIILIAINSLVPNHLEVINNQNSACFLSDSVCVLVSQLCLTLCDPMDYSPPRLLWPWNSPGKNTGMSCNSLLQGNLPNLGIKPGSSALQADSLPSELPGKPVIVHTLRFMHEIWGWAKAFIINFMGSLCKTFPLSAVSWVLSVSLEAPSFLFPESTGCM